MKNNELNWEWNKKPVPLSKLNEGQLNVVKQFLKKSNKHIIFGNKRKDYIMSIKSIENQRNIDSFNEIVDQMHKTINQRAYKAVDKFMTHSIFTNVLKSAV